MKKFEYKYFDYGHPEPPPPNFRTRQLEIMAELGNDGWEIISVADKTCLFDDELRWSFIFLCKRERVE